MPRPSTAIGFRGMNNLPQAPGKLVDEERKITPRLALNVLVTDGGVLIKRGGYAQKIDLPGAHSLWGETALFVVAAGVLYRVEGETVTSLAEIPGPGAIMSYAEIDNRVFMSNPYWRGILDLITGVLGTWGLDLPEAPDVTMTSGDLPPGRYVLCYTRTDGTRLSGNGPLTEISWEGGTQGIRLGNLPPGGQCWITQPDGKKLLQAIVVGNQIIGQGPTIKPLPSFKVCPPPNMTHFCQAFGRIWGINGKQVFYSEPFQYEWFRAGNYVPFLEDLVMVAPVNEGIFVNSRYSTWFLDGTTPAEMAVKRIGNGATPGTLTFAQMPGAVVGGGSEMSRRQGQLPSPVWMGRNGLVVGTHTGHLVHLTEARLKINPRNQGASLYYMKDGIPRVISSLHGLPAKEDQDEDLSRIFEEGKIFN